MSIAFDGRPLLGPRTGVGTWTVAVAGGLARRGERVVLHAPRPLALPPELAGAGVRAVAPRGPRLPGTLWLHTALRARLLETGAEVFVAGLAIAPRRPPVPTVAMVHDLTPRTLPHRHTLANRFCFNAYLETSLEEAAAVVVGTAAVERELLAAFPRVAPKLVRIGYGVDPWFSPPRAHDDGEAVRRRFAGGRPYLLHLGTLEPRKGIPTLVAAWEALVAARPGAPDLVVAGGRGWGTGPILERIRRSPHADRIHLPGYVDRAAARDLLRHAEAFVLASEAEGFGLPLAEALACGTPAIASDIPVLREVAGDAALYAPPGDAGAFAAALAAALEPGRAAALRERALRRAAALSWERVVARWAELLETVRSGRAPRP